MPFADGSGLGHCKRCGRFVIVPDWLLAAGKIRVSACDNCITTEETRKLLKEAQEAMDKIDIGGRHEQVYE